MRETKRGDGSFRGWWGLVLVLVATCAVLTAGCGEPPEQTEDTGWRLGDTGPDDGTDTGAPDGEGDTGFDDTVVDTGSEVGVDAGTDTDGGETNTRYETTFRLKNAGETSIAIRPTDTCASDTAGWLTLTGPSGQVEVSGGCGLCDCSDLQESNGCAVCAKPRCKQPPPVELRPGSEAEWTWKGEVWKQGTVDGTMCERPTIPEKGTEFSAEFCWATSGESTTSETCKTVTFEYGNDPVVEQVARPDKETEPVQMRFGLKNDTQEAVWVRTPTFCTPRDDEWVSLYDGDVQVDFQTDCTVCSCSRISGGSVCAVCEKLCRGSSLEKLEPGDSMRRSWDGTGYRREQRDGQMCHAEWVPDRGETVEATFCWYVADPRTADGLSPDCKSVKFRYGEQTTLDERIGGG